MPGLEWILKNDNIISSRGFPMVITVWDFILYQLIIHHFLSPIITLRNVTENLFYALSPHQNLYSWPLRHSPY